MNPVTPTCELVFKGAREGTRGSGYKAGTGSARGIRVVCVCDLVCLALGSSKDVSIGVGEGAPLGWFLMGLLDAVRLPLVLAEIADG